MTNFVNLNRHAPEEANLRIQKLCHRLNDIGNHLHCATEQELKSYEAEIRAIKSALPHYRNLANMAKH